ncbi:hypothetical protein KIN20_024106 [Parelaphostrongylus tenuis]|uniref:Uncharacterized protein n=1 Tax=Parelaphostrongylus tenuis TaxID=148309 RepID=A0AAD5MXT7_PARTN|nr:hypothetical protein KIN20_024106 [Parelaphostrongylus tenuis]
MGAAQSLENQASSPQKDIVQSIPSSSLETSPSPSISADVKFDAVTSSKLNQAGDNLIINDMKIPVSAKRVTQMIHDLREQVVSQRFEERVQKMVQVAWAAPS